MGKFVIIPIHPSNEFFLSFPNCLGYRNEFEFVASFHWAQNNEPLPMTTELAAKLTWEAATDRFIEASVITVEEAHNRKQHGQTKLDERIAWFHNELGKGKRGDMLRKLLGGGPVSDQVKYVNGTQDETTSGRLTDSDDTESLSSSESLVNDGQVISDISASSDGEMGDDELGGNSKFRQSAFSTAVRVRLSSLKKQYHDSG
jgi:hypothetical protein